MMMSVGVETLVSVILVMSKKEEKKEIDVDKLINEYECPYMLKQGIKHYFKSVEVKSVKDFDKKLKEYLNKKL
jgi:hypothetical protein